MRKRLKKWLCKLSGCKSESLQVRADESVPGGGLKKDPPQDQGNG